MTLINGNTTPTCLWRSMASRQSPACATPERGEFDWRRNSKQQIGQTRRAAFCPTERGQIAFRFIPLRLRPIREIARSYNVHNTTISRLA
jgi:hypothetical protein